MKMAPVSGSTSSTPPVFPAVIWYRNLAFVPVNYQQCQKTHFLKQTDAWDVEMKYKSYNNWLVVLFLFYHFCGLLKHAAMSDYLPAFSVLVCPTVVCLYKTCLCNEVIALFLLYLRGQKWSATYPSHQVPCPTLKSRFTGSLSTKLKVLWVGKSFCSTSLPHLPQPPTEWEESSAVRISSHFTSTLREQSFGTCAITKKVVFHHTVKLN